MRLVFYIIQEGFHFSSQLTVTLNFCLIYFKISGALAILIENMLKKFEINRTKTKGICQSGRKVVTHDSKSDLPLTRPHLPVCAQKSDTLNCETAKCKIDQENRGETGMKIVQFMVDFSCQL